MQDPRSGRSAGGALTPGRKFGFDELMGGYHTLRDALPGIDIGYGTRQGLSKYIKDEAERPSYLLMAATKTHRAP